MKEAIAILLSYYQTHLIECGVTFSCLIPLGIIAKTKPRFTTGTYSMFLYVLFSFSFGLTIDTFTSLWFNNYLLYSIFCIVEYLLIAVFFYEIYRSKGYRNSLKVLSGVFVLYYLLNVFLWQKNTFSSHNYAVSSLLMILFSLAYFRQLLQSLSIPNLSESASFWITIAIFFYASGSFFVYLFSEMVLDQSVYRFIGDYWVIISALKILMQLLLARGFWNADKA